MWNHPLPKSYQRGIVLWVAAFVASIFLSKFLRDYLQESTTLYELAAMLPVLPVAGMAFFDWRNFLGTMDEMQQRIYLEALYFASQVLILYCVSTLLLEYVLGYPRLPPFSVLPVFVGGTILGWWIARRRYA